VLGTLKHFSLHWDSDSKYEKFPSAIKQARKIESFIAISSADSKRDVGFTNDIINKEGSKRLI
jgi:hypothetical protein